MKNLREAAQKALEALEDSHQNINPERSYAEDLTRQISGAITALRAALADTQDWNEVEALRASLREHMAEIQRLRAAGRQALEALENHTHEAQRIGRIAVAINALRKALVELTEYAMQRLAADTRICTCHPADNPPKPCPRKYALSECREAALAEDRSADADKTSDHIADANKMVEPVAFFYKNFTRRIRGVLTQEDFVGDKSAFLEYCMSDENLLPLYLAPPKREPLTDDELVRRWQAIDHGKIGHTIDFARAIERAHGIGGEE